MMVIFNGLTNKTSRN